MVVDLRGQVNDLGRRTAGFGLTFLVFETHQFVLVGDVEVAIVEGQSIGGIKFIGEDVLHFVAAVAIGISQQGQPVTAFDRRVALRLDVTGDHVFRFQLGRIAATTFGHKDVAVGQHQGLARDLQVGGYRRHAVVFRHRGCCIAPGCRLGDLHARQQPAVGFRQFGVGTVQAGGVLLIATTGA